MEETKLIFADDIPYIDFLFRCSAAPPSPASPCPSAAAASPGQGSPSTTWTSPRSTPPSSWASPTPSEPSPASSAPPSQGSSSGTRWFPEKKTNYFYFSNNLNFVPRPRRSGSTCSWSRLAFTWPGRWPTGSWRRGRGRTGRGQW